MHPQRKGSELTSGSTSPVPQRGGFFYYMLKTVYNILDVFSMHLTLLRD